MSAKVPVTDVNHYAVLGVERNATTAQITTGYRRKALKCHPDKNPDNPNAAQSFHRLSEALKVLTNPASRAAFDKILSARIVSKPPTTVCVYCQKTFGTVECHRPWRCDPNWGFQRKDPAERAAAAAYAASPAAQQRKQEEARMRQRFKEELEARWKAAEMAAEQQRKAAEQLERQKENMRQAGRRYQAEQERLRLQAEQEWLIYQAEQERLRLQAEQERVKYQAEQERLKNQADQERLKNQADEERLKNQADQERLKSQAEQERLKSEVNEEQLKQQFEPYRLKYQADPNSLIEDLTIVLIQLIAEHNITIDQKQNITLDQKQNITVDQKQNITLDQKQNFTLDHKEDITIDRKENITLDNKQNITLDQKQDVALDHSLILRLKWRSKKTDVENGGYSADVIEYLFSHYGEVSAVIVSSRRKGSAIIEFTTKSAASEALRRERGLPSNPLTVTRSSLLEEKPADVSRSPFVEFNAPNTKKTASKRETDEIINNFEKMKV